MDLEKRLLDIVAGERMTEKDFEQFYKYGDILALGRAACMVRDRRYPDGVVTLLLIAI